MSERKQIPVFVVLSAFSILFLLAGACTAGAIPPAAAHAGSVGAATGNDTPPATGSTTIRGTVADLHRMNCPCFTLVTATGNVTVWYDLMVSPDGTRLPAVPIDTLADGMAIRVTGTGQAGGKFLAAAIGPDGS